MARNHEDMPVEAIDGETSPAGGERMPSRARVERIARATLRRHAASPLTGTPPFWERVAETVLTAHLADGLQAPPSPERVDEIARLTAPAFSASPVTNSETLWRGIVATVLTEFAEPSGMGQAIPYRGRLRDGDRAAANGEEYGGSAPG